MDTKSIYYENNIVKAIRLVKSLVREDFEINKFDKVASEVKHDFTIGLVHFANIWEKI